MIPEPPPGQGPIDPRGAFAPPPPPPNMQQQWPGGFPGGGPLPPMGPGMFPPPPPPGMFPPPFMMPPPPQKRSGGGFARAIFMTLATTIFALSLTLNIYLLAISGLAGGGGGAHTTSLLDGDPAQKIAVVPIKGVIMDEAAEQFDRFMKSVEQDKSVKAIVLEVDSPGGSVTASDVIHHRIEKYKRAHPKVPVVVAMGSLAASGGYYVSCPADYIVAQPTTLTGNIGVLMPQYNVSELFDKWGIKETTIESTGATFKNAGSMFRPEKPEERAYIQDIADKAFTQFKDVIAKGRTGKPNFDPKKLDAVANGKIYVAADALGHGLIDKVGYLEDAYDYAASQAKLNKRTIVKYHEPPNLLDALMSSRSNLTRGTSSAGGGVTINGVNVNADDLRELMTPRLMYLWRGQ